MLCCVVTKRMCWLFSCFYKVVVDPGFIISALNSPALATPVFCVPAAQGLMSRWAVGSLPSALLPSCVPHLVIDPRRPDTFPLL